MNELTVKEVESLGFKYAGEVVAGQGYNDALYKKGDFEIVHRVCYVKGWEAYGKKLHSKEDIISTYNKWVDSQIKHLEKVIKKANTKLAHLKKI